MKKKSLPPRGIRGWFIKKTDSTAELSESTLGNSSPLDTPEINECALIDNDTSTSEHEVNEQLETQEDDEESLPGAPDPSITIPTSEFIHQIPFPFTQYLQQLIVPTTSKPRVSLTRSIVPPPVPAQVQYFPMATMPTPSLFSGNNNENPQNFFMRSRKIYPHQQNHGRSDKSHTIQHVHISRLASRYMVGQFDGCTDSLLGRHQNSISSTLASHSGSSKVQARLPERAPNAEAEGGRHEGVHYSSRCINLVTPTLPWTPAKASAGCGHNGDLHQTGVVHG
jgi:hypothetical protein